jgi:hypothetical protein
MKTGFVRSMVILTMILGGFATVSLAQQHTASPESVTLSSADNEVSLQGATQPDDEQLRYQFVPHQFGVNNTLQEIYIKLDCFTGKTWRFHASTAKWTLIPEPATGQPLEASDLNRYELMTHDYFDTYSEEQELIIRVDRVSGATWTYRGATGIWKQIQQEN